MAELPAQSRITSRIDGDEIVLTIPNAAGGSRGCLQGSWGVAAVFGFLAITFAAQGFLSKNLGWTVGGVVCFVITAWQLVDLRGLAGRSGRIEIRVGSETLSRRRFVGEAVERGDWMRSGVEGIGVEEGRALRLRLKGENDAVSLVSGIDLEELKWIEGQIRLKWKMDRDGSVK